MYSRVDEQQESQHRVRTVRDKTRVIFVPLLNHSRSIITATVEHAARLLIFFSSLANRRSVAKRRSRVTTVPKIVRDSVARDFASLSQRARLNEINVFAPKNRVLKSITANITTVIRMTTIIIYCCCRNRRFYVILRVWR